MVVVIFLIMSCDFIEPLYYCFFFRSNLWLSQLRT